MRKYSCLLGFLAVAGLNTMSCRGSHAKDPQVSQEALRISSLRFAQKTQLVGSGGASSGSGGFNAGTYPSAGFWPAVPLVVPARAAAFINENYGATGGFTYQSFEFTSTSCSASNAFARYFAAIEQLSGSPLSQSQKDGIKEAFQGSFMDGETGILNQSVCLFYDLMACIADYAVQNEAIFKQGAQSGDTQVIMTGAVSCIAEITGIDPTDTIDPFDPSSTTPSE
jgi:hypothetical protein